MNRPSVEARWGLSTGTDPARHALSDIASFHASALLRQETANADGWGQRLPAGVKILGVLPWLLAVSFIRRPEILALAAVLPAVWAASCRLPFRAFMARSWLFAPLFTGLIALPVAFSVLTPGHPLIPIWKDFSITREGAAIVLTLVLRVGASVSWVLWLLGVTGWHRLAGGLRDLGLPRLVVFLLTMTVRFLTVQLDTAVEMHLGRLSRPMFRMSRRSRRRWSADRIADLLRRTRQLAESVDDGLRSRGWEAVPPPVRQAGAGRQGDPPGAKRRRFDPSDVLWISFSLAAAACLAWLGR